MVCFCLKILMLRIKHKQRECIGCDACAELAPQYFVIDGEGKARLRHVTHSAHNFDFAVAYPDDLAQLQAAAESCAVQIIAVG